MPLKTKKLTFKNMLICNKNDSNILLKILLYAFIKKKNLKMLGKKIYKIWILYIYTI